MDNQQLQKRIDELEKKVKSLEQSNTISYQVENAFVGRGFVEQQKFFIAGTGECNAFGESRTALPRITSNSIALVTGYENAVAGQLTTGYDSNNYGGSSSQFDITNPAGDTFRYTWDGTGTNPGISSSTLPAGSRIQIFSINFNPANQNSAGRPFFIVTDSGSNYFEVDNPTPGVVEANVTLGSGGSITGGAANDTSELLVQGLATDQFSFVVFQFNELYARI